jgi:hypothetical protein
MPRRFDEQKSKGSPHQGNGETINLLPRRVLPPETFCFAASLRQHGRRTALRECTGANLRCETLTDERNADDKGILLGDFQSTNSAWGPFVPR